MCGLWPCAYAHLQLYSMLFSGVDGIKGHEWIRVEGTTTRNLLMSAYGFEGGEANITYSYS